MTFSLNIANTKKGKETDNNKKHNIIYISVNVHNCSTNTTDSTYTMNVPKNRNIGILKQVLESLPSTKIQVERFIFSQQYVSEFDTFEDLSVTDGSTIIALGDSKKVPKPKSLTPPSRYHMRGSNVPDNLSAEEEQARSKSKDSMFDRESSRLLDIKLMKIERHPRIFRKYIYQENMYIQENMPEIKSPSLNIDYKKPSGPSEDPLPVTWQF